jgi:hypothetical protein
MKTFGIEAIRDFESDFERALADLELAIAGIVDFEEDAKDAASVDLVKGSFLSLAKLRDLLDRLAEAPEAATSAFEDFGWEFRRALRALKETLVREPAEG